MELVNELYAFCGRPGCCADRPRRRRAEARRQRSSAPETVAVLKEAVEALVLMISPFAPHMAEELWELLGHTGGIVAAGWPAFDEAVARAERDRRAGAGERQGPRAADGAGRHVRGAAARAGARRSAGREAPRRQDRARRSSSVNGQARQHRGRADESPSAAVARRWSLRCSRVALSARAAAIRWPAAARSCRRTSRPSACRRSRTTRRCSTSSGASPSRVRVGADRPRQVQGRARPRPASMRC